MMQRSEPASMLKQSVQIQSLDISECLGQHFINY